MAAMAKAAYLEDLRALVAARVRFVVVGSFGLELFLGEAFGHEPKGCDVVAHAHITNLERAVGVLRARGYGVRLAGHPVGERLDGDSLAGKRALCATRAAERLDVHYEPEALDWPRITYAVADLEGVPVAAIETIVAMNERSSRPEDRAMAAHVRALLAR